MAPFDHGRVALERVLRVFEQIQQPASPPQLEPGRASRAARLLTATTVE